MSALAEAEARIRATGLPLAYLAWPRRFAVALDYVNNGDPAVLEIYRRIARDGSAALTALAAELADA